MYKLKKSILFIAIFLCIGNLYSNSINTTSKWSFNDDFEGVKNTEFWQEGIYATYGITDPTNADNKVLKIDFVPNSAGGGDTWGGYNFKLPIDAVKLTLSWKQYIPKNYRSLKRFQNFFTLWSNSTSTANSNILIGSSLWGRYSELGAIPSVRVGIDGHGLGHNMNSNNKPMLENEAGKWVDIKVDVELAKDSNSFGKMNIYKDGELLTGTSSETLLQSWGEPKGPELVRYSTSGNFLNKGKLLGWASGSFDETVSFLVDDFKLIASSSFEDELTPNNTNIDKSDFVSFKGAPEDQALIDEIMKKYFVINEPKRIIYVAPMTSDNMQDGSGNSKDDPKRNLKLALENAVPGDHFYLAPGVYNTPLISIAGKHNGTLEDKIVVKTDPSLYDPKNGKIAQIDFNFKNNSDRAFGLYVSHWVIEDLEIRNMNGIGIAIAGRYNLIRNNNIHHGKLISNNNLALIMSKTDVGKSYNLIIKNHLHHFGIFDADNKELKSPNEVLNTISNGGCFYSEEVQYYKVEDKVKNAGYYTRDEWGNIQVKPEWRDLSWNEIKDRFLLEPSSDVYLYNNAVDNCYPFGLASKTTTTGPYYFLSNVVHSTLTGIKASLGGTVVRNNIIYKDKWMKLGIKYGQEYNTRSIQGNLVAGVGMKVTNNTIVGPKKGIEFRTGWDGYVANNILLDVEIPHYLSHMYHSWSTNKVGRIDNQGNPKYTILFTGEYLYGDIDPGNDMFEDMPLSLQQLGYKKLKIENDIYMVDPIIKPLIWDDQANYLNLEKTTENYTIYSSETVRSYMNDPENYDYRRNKDKPGILSNMGSNIQ
ncbi:hypothetical protein [Arcobacter sp.]|uniref:hypothetical protein n=1 Tax=Arcobacter sp. TaxID=1872629 RepID=UPI003D13F0BB